MLRGYISRVEHGHTVPSVETLQRFAGALDVPLYQLFYNAEDGELPAAVGGQPTPTTLEDLAQSTDAEGSEARFLLQMKGVTGNMTKSERAFVLDFAYKLANRR
jgi:transcriptional regulator with XRE-family HTH domain